MMFKDIQLSNFSSKIKVKIQKIMMMNVIMNPLLNGHLINKEKPFMEESVKNQTKKRKKKRKKMTIVEIMLKLQKHPVKMMTMMLLF